MICPLCHDQLVPVQAGGVTIDRCQDCGATWFDAHELSAVRSGPDIEPKLRQAAHGRWRCRYCGENAEGLEKHCGHPVRALCPKCVSVLSFVHGEPIDVDVCFGCGGLLVDGPSVGRLNELLPPTPPEPPHLELGFNPSAIEVLVGRAVADRRLI